MVQVLIGASKGQLFTTLLRLDASSAMTPRVASKSIPNSNRGLRPKPKNHPASGFEAQTTKIPGEAYPLGLLHDLDICHRRPQPPN